MKTRSMRTLIVGMRNQAKLRLFIPVFLGHAVVTRLEWPESCLDFGDTPNDKHGQRRLSGVGHLLSA